MDRQGKEKLKGEFSESFKKAKAVIVTHYRGLTVEEISSLRRELRKSDAVFKVVKNRIAKKAIQDDVKDMESLTPDLKGPVGVVYAFGDSAQVTKTVLEFQKEHPAFAVKAGFMENSSVSFNQLKAIADLPSKEVLLAQIVGSLVAPHRNLLSVLSGVPRQLVTVLAAIRDKKSA